MDHSAVRSKIQRRITIHIRGVPNADTPFLQKMKHALRMENTERCVFAGTGKYDIPVILPETEIRIDKLEWIPVDYATVAKDRATKGIHFYKDDYKFEQYWNNPDKYIPLLKQYGAVLSPDFSVYNDMPLAVQIFMHYKKHWLAAYWQMHGVHVIPTIRTCGKESYDWCFDGEPTNGIISISSHGTQRDPYEAECFAEHCRVILERLKPTSVLWYGKCPEEFDWNVTKIKPFTHERGIYYAKGRIREQQ